MKRSNLLFVFVMLTGLHCIPQNNGGSGGYPVWDKDARNLSVGHLKNMFGPNYAPGSAISNDVNLFTGSNSVCIPLWTGTARGITIPVTISYNATGIKVNQMASSVGLGWNLNAGGCIRRIVHGMRDDTFNEDERGWIASDFDNGHNVSVGSEIAQYDPSTAYMNHILANPVNADNPTQHDTESDEYIIDCPYLQGSFVFSNKSLPFDWTALNTKPIIRNCTQSNLRISCNQNSDSFEIMSFTVVDENGNTFYFDKLEKYRSYNYSAYVNWASSQTYSFFNAVYSFKSEVDQEYTTAWFLTKIKTYHGDDLVFDYEQEKYIADPSYVDFFRTSPDPNSSENPYKRYLSQYINCAIFLINPSIADHVVTWRIKTISSPEFRMDFLAWNNREDVFQYPPANTEACKRIDKIRFFNRYNAGMNDTVLVRQFDFNYHYEQSPISNTFPHGNDLPGNNVRMYLDTLIESTNYKTFPPYSFSYIQLPNQQLPGRFSYAADIWGYYNGMLGNATAVPTVFIYPTYLSNDRFWCYSFSGEDNLPQAIALPGANRMPDTTLMKLGTLEKIQYPSGAITTFSYEPHQFNFKGHRIVGGGLRLKMKQVFDTNTKLSEELYTYEQGEALGFPAYGYFDPLFLESEDPTRYWFRSYVRTGINIGNSDGNVGYGKVTVYNPGMGITENYFENSQTLSNSPNSIPSVGYYALQNISSGIDLVNLDDTTPPRFQSELNLATYPFPYANKYNTDWFRGRLMQQKSRNENGALVKELFYLYEERYPGIPGLTDFHPDMDTVFGLRVSFLDNDKGTWGSPYAAVSRFARYTGVASMLKKKITRNYDDNGIAIADQVVEFKYNKYNQLSRTESNNSDGSILVQSNKWVLDYFDVRKFSISLANINGSQARAMLILADSNVINSKIEERSMIWRQTDTVVLSGKISTFNAVQNNQQSNRYLLNQEYFLQTKVPISTNANVPDHYNVSGMSDDDSFIFDTRYKPRLTIDTYDDKLRITSSHVEGDNTTSFIWDNYLDVMNATVMNAKPNECIYTGFEFRNPFLSPLPPRSHVVKTSAGSCAFAGDYMLQLEPICFACFLTPTIFNSDENQGYTASVWAKGDAGVSLCLQLYSGNQLVLTKTVENSGSITDWHLLTLSFSKTELSDFSSFYLKAGISNNGLINGFIDEVKIYPNDGVITTWSYDTKSNMLAYSVPGEIYATNEYDDLGRKVLERDFNRNILSKKEYNSGNPALFSWCDNSGNNNGKPEKNEQIVFSVNSEGLTGAQCQYKISNMSHSIITQAPFINNKFYYTFNMDGCYDPFLDFYITVDVTANGIIYTKTRLIRIYNPI